MTKVILLEELKKFSQNATRDLLLPVCMKEGDEVEKYRAPDVYLTRLPDSKSAKKKAPYILHQSLTGKDILLPQKQQESTAYVRTIFCVYHRDEQEGGLALLNLMERLRIELLRRGVVGGQFKLDLESGLEMLVYPGENLESYYAGEMLSVWKLPTIEREVSYVEKGNSNFK